MSKDEPIRKVDSERKKKFAQELLNAISNISNFEKKINEVIADLHRTQLELIKNQNEMARSVVAIDKQQSRLVNQMNFLTKMADKLAKNSDICKDSQVRLNEKLNTVSCIESMITDDFIFIRNELQVGNKSVMEELGQTKDMISSTEKNFYTYESNMNLLKSMVLERIAELHKLLDQIPKNQDKKEQISNSPSTQRATNTETTTTLPASK